MNYWGWLVLVIASACGKVQSPAGEIDAPVGCETDQELCAQLGNGCEVHTVADRCGTQRTVDCGSCDGGQGCVEGSCRTPVCDRFDYVATISADLSRPDLEDSVGAASPDGEVILYHPSVEGCGAFSARIADAVVGGYTSQDATRIFAEHRLLIGQSANAIAADGLSFVALTQDRKKIVFTRRSARGLIDFAAPSEAMFVQINATIENTNAQFFAPVLSADGLQFLYTISGGADPNNGVYSAVRASTSEPFPLGTRMPPPVNDSGYGAPSGISSDRLTLFVFDNYNTRALTRTSTRGAFTNPNAPADPPLIHGWEVKPFADCARMVAMESIPGGCIREDIIFLTRR